MTTSLTELLGIDIPIIQAPTASIAGPELAEAVSAAGALSSMGLTWTSADAACHHVRWIKEKTGRPFLVNFALAFEPVALETVLREGVAVVGLSWGDPAPYVDRIHKAGSLLAVQVGNLTGALQATAAGADIVICQGLEAGGHVQSTTERDPLLIAVVAAIGGRIPVVAAGGISDASGIADAMRLGAAGVMMGTRFVATRESRAHPAYKQQLIDAGANATALTTCFDGGWPHAPHRVLRNSTLESWEAAGCPLPGRRPGDGVTVAAAASGEPILRYEDTAPRAGMSGEIESMALYAGKGVSTIHDLPPAAELVRRLWADTLQLL